MNSVSDVELLSEAKRSRLEIEPLDGSTIANTIKGLYEVDPAGVARLKEIIAVKR